METATATKPVETQPTKTNESIITDALERQGEPKLAPDESMDVRPITARCFRVNIWKSGADGRQVVANNRIVRSYFVTLRSPDDVEIIKS
jgi:hypothetical protein